MRRSALVLAVVVITLHASSFAEETRIDVMSIKLLDVHPEQWIQAGESNVLAEFGQPGTRKRNRRTGSSRLIYTAPVFGDMLSVSADETWPPASVPSIGSDPSGPGPESPASSTRELRSTVGPLKVLGKVRVVFHVDSSGRVSSVDRTVRHKKK